MELISSTRFEINDIHDTVGLLEQVECPLILFSLDKTVSAVVQLSQHDWDLVLADTQLFIVVLIEGIVLVERGRGVSPGGCCLGSTDGRC